MQLWNLQSNEKTRAKRKLKGSTPEGSDPKDSPTTTTTTTTEHVPLHSKSLCKNVARASGGRK